MHVGNTTEAYLTISAYDLQRVNVTKMECPRFSSENNTIINRLRKVLYKLGDAICFLLEIGDTYPSHRTCGSQATGETVNQSLPHKEQKLDRLR